MALLLGEKGGPVAAAGRGRRRRRRRRWGCVVLPRQRGVGGRTAWASLGLKQGRPGRHPALGALPMRLPGPSAALWAFGSAGERRRGTRPGPGWERRDPPLCLGQAGGSVRVREREARKWCFCHLVG